MAARKYIPQDELRAKIQNWAGLGIPQEQIGLLAGISKPTLIKYYRKELSQGTARANANIAGRLYQEAMAGNIAALIFWAKSHMGWREKDREDEQAKQEAKKPEPINFYRKPPPESHD